MSSRTRVRRTAAALVAAPLCALAFTSAAAAAPTFAPTAIRSGGPFEIWQMAVGDFDGDGRPDVISPMFDSGGWGGGVSLWRSRADGGLRSATKTTVSGNVDAVAVGDLNGDGDLDAVVGETNADLTTLLNRGDGTFATTSSTAFVGTLALADFDGDGDLDLLNGGGETLEVWPGAGDGTFGTPVTTTVAGLDVFRLDVGDFDGDGIADVVTSGYYDGPTILRGAGDGTFTVAWEIPGLRVQSLRAADLDGDGLADVAASTQWTERLTTILVKASGPQPARSVATDGEGRVIALGDVDGDGIADVTTIEYNWGTVSTHHGFGDGSFGPARTFDVYDLGITSPKDVAVADFDGDGRLDVAIGDQAAGAVVLRNTSRPGAAVGSATLDLGSQPRSTIGAPQTVLVTNTGDAWLHVGAPALSGTDAGDFLAGRCDAPVPAGGSCALPVRFLPSAAGARAATLTIPTDAPGGPLTVSLSGTGGELPAGPAGNDGADGADGADGRDGANGADGRDGAAGSDGRDGADGKDGAAGATGPQGPAGATGPQGPAGATGPQGPAGRDGAAAPLALVLSARRLSAAAGRRSQVAFGATAAGRVELTVLRGKRRVATARAVLRRAGSGAVKLKGLPRGSYRLRLMLRAADGRSTTVAAALVVRR
jgi:hypothetical protein